MTVSIHDFTVYRCKGATEITRKVKNLRKRQAGFCGCEFIVKNTAYTPCFFAMFDKKVVVCPSLEIAIKIRMVAIANIFQGLMKIPCILRHYIMWCKRSEERRVGKECRSRWPRYHYRRDIHKCREVE